MKYKTFSPILTVTKNLEGNTIPNIDGQFIVTKDGGGIYYDNGIDRILASKDDTKLPLTGGGINGSLWVRDDISTNGNVYIGTSDKDTQTTVGVNSSAGEFALHSNPSSGMRGIWDAKSGDYLAYLDSSNNVYYKGGMVTSNLFIGDSYKITESQIGVNSTAGKLYLYSTPDNGARGIYAENFGYLAYLGSDGAVHYQTGNVDGNFFTGNSSLSDKEMIIGSTSSVGSVYLYSHPSNSVAGIYTTGTYSGGSNTYLIERNQKVGNITHRGIAAGCSWLGGGKNATSASFDSRYTTNTGNESVYPHLRMATSMGSAYVLGTYAYEGNNDTMYLAYYSSSQLSGSTNAVTKLWRFDPDGATVTQGNIYSNGQTSYKCPVAYYGTSTPSSSTGVNGDIYVVYS
jgi:hypothetical protein